MKPIIYAVLLCSVAVITSCNKHIYVPNTVNVPLLKEKHEFKGSISPTNLQTAFAITNNIAIMANGQYVYRFKFNDSINNDLFSDNNTRGGLIEGAIGYFKPLDPKKRMVFDVYGGFGGGHFKTLTVKRTSGSNPDDYTIKNQFTKVFIQPSIGFVHPVIEAAFSSRFSLLNFYNTQMGPKAFENDATGKANFMRISDKPVFFYEPALTFRVGYKYVKFQAQLQFSLPLKDNTYDTFDVNDYFQPVAFGMGASINIARWYDEFRKK
ncbi:MAG TPA: hypothetical protein VM802_14780 [Chitinophaga sp.]|uniref:hypothetical protein n=1 Tax=Chitinophaga sp. TaxID=1869181 RepID=UPI002D0C09EE|nr:hypothetical protein [Chitinophaga sp.]HVI46138.1 hypothetical protein [Chitinophaga sp.]